MKLWLWGVNVVGGVAVLGSYAWGVLTQPEPGRLWGRIPEVVQLPYSLCMPLAAAGYLTLLVYLHRHPDWRAIVAMAVLLVLSAAWMPLSFQALAEPRLHLLVQFLLLGVALASMSLLVLVAGGPEDPWKSRALVGMLAFCWQTVVLDALVWPRFFP